MSSLGWSVTQSSISRDFKELGVAKIDGRYVVSTNSAAFGLARFVLSTETAGPNLVVVKTQSGWSVAISDAIDDRELVGVVGTIAGENTIMIATTDAGVHAKIEEFVRSL